MPETKRQSWWWGAGPRGRAEGGLDRGGKQPSGSGHSQCQATPEAQQAASTLLRALGQPSHRRWGDSQKGWVTSCCYQPLPNRSPETSSLRTKSTSCLTHHQKAKICLVLAHSLSRTNTAAGARAIWRPEGAQGSFQWVSWEGRGVSGRGGPRPLLRGGRHRRGHVPDGQKAAAPSGYSHVQVCAASCHSASPDLFTTTQHRDYSPMVTRVNYEPPPK